MSKKVSIARCAAIALLCSVPGLASAEVVDLDAVRAATEKYQDVNAALADGYIRDPANLCISAAAEGLPAEWGAMGVHYINPMLLGITAGESRVDGNGTNTDWMQPSVVIYEPQADGSLELVAVENLVWQAAWEETGQPTPEINGKVWDTMADDPDTAADEAHNFMPHFDQHVWLYRDNPAGMMQAFNPAITCEHHTGS